MSDNTYLSLDEQSESIIKKNSISDYKAFTFLLRDAKPYKISILFAILLMILGALLLIISARLVGLFVENGLMARDLYTSLYLIVSIIFLEALSVFSIWYGKKRLSGCSSKIIYDIRKRLFNHIQKLPMSYYDRQPQGRIVTRITHDVEGIEEFFTSSLNQMLNASFITAIVIVAMLLTNFKLGVIILLSTIPIILFINFSRKKFRSLNRSISLSNSALNARLSEYLSGFRLIRSSGLENWSKDNYVKSAKDLLHVRLNANFYFGWMRPVISILCALPTICLVFYGGHMVLSGVLGVGMFVTFIRYCERFNHPIVTLARQFHVIQQAFTNAERVALFLQESTEDQTFTKSSLIIPNINRLEGNIKVDNLWMAYSKEDWILKEVSFCINSGETIGIVGITGSGKTTMASMFSRLYEFQLGEILIDDIPIRAYSREFIRNKIGSVSQDAVIFYGSLRENLIMDYRHLSDMDIMEACQYTGLLEIMRNANLSLDSEILDGGINLSVGERQLVSFTRVILKDPDILILDEATANIDNKYEEIVHNAFKKLAARQTCIIIAHRLSTIKDCDRILVFNRGRLVENGTHDGLLLKRGYFFNLHNANYFSSV